MLILFLGEKGSKSKWVGFKTSWNSKSAKAQNTLFPAYGTDKCFVCCTGKKSYKEHGNRMLLIWLHGTLLAHQNPVKHIYEDLVEAGLQPSAGKLCCTEHITPSSARPQCGAEVPAGAGKVWPWWTVSSFLGICPCWGVRLLEEENLSETWDF